MKRSSLILWCGICAASSLQAQLFSDSFSGTNLSPFVAQSGNWAVTNGVLRGGLNPIDSYGLAYITNLFTNFSGQAQFQFPVGAYGGGLGGRFNPANGSHYAVWIYPENSVGGSNELKLIRFDSYSSSSASFVVLQTTNLAAVGTNFHTATLQFSGSLISAYFDTNKLLSVTDATYPSGSISLDFWTDATAYQMTVSNLAVYALPLVASNDSYTAVLGLPLTVAAPGVLVNDTGGNGPLTATLVTAPAHGTFTLTNNGGFTYNATNNFTGNDTFTYKASDGQTNSTATVTITVTPDHPPVANNDAYTMLQNSTLSVAAPGVLANDTDADGNTLTAVLVSGPANGALTLTNNGGFTYTPTSGFAGIDSFAYKANDGLSNSANATVTISVLSIVPLFSDTFSGTSLSPWLTNSGNWTVTNGALLGGTNPLSSYGVAYITNSWSNYSAQASIQLSAGAYGGGVDACLNPATGARYAAWIYPEGSPGGSNTLKLIKFQTWTTFGYNGLNNSVPMQSVNLSSVGTIAHTLKLACAGSRIAVFLDGTLMISQTDTDSETGPYLSGAVGVDFWTAATEYQMSVQNVLVESLVNNDSYSTTQNTPLTVNAPGVLGNDTEIYGSNLTAVQITGPTNGTLTLTNNGGFTYTPTAGYMGPDSFTYQANDGGASLGVATVNITVLLGGFSQNFDGVTAPALPSGWTTSATGVQTNWVTRTNASDTSPNAAYVPDPANVGDSYLVSPAIALPGGQARLTFRNNYSLESDANGYYDGGVLEIKIGAGAFTDILAAGGSFISNGYSGTISLLYSNSLAGRLAWSGNSGGFITTAVDLPAAAAGQTIQLRWHCGTDNGNGSSGTNGWYIDTVVITNCACACCWNTPPLLPAQSNQTVNMLTTLTVTNTATDADLPPQTLTYTLLAPPANAAISTSGVITWTPTSAQAPGTNTLTTRVMDSGSPALSATNSFTVVVLDVNVAPVLPVIPTNTVNELTLLTVTNTAIETNVHATSSYTLVSPPSGASINTNGIITWTPSQTQSPSTNTLTTVVTNTDADDPGNLHLSATNSFTVVVREVNVAPVLPPNQSNRTVAVLTLLTVTNTATETNIHATLGYTLVNPPAGASINTNGIITWTPTSAQAPSTNTLTTVVTNTDPYDPVNPHLSATNSFTVVVLNGPLVVLSSAVLAAESCLPTNGVIDPGETVTVLFGLQNVGGANTTNLVVTLLATNGVSGPSGPQTYGVLVPGGGAASQPFTFAANGSCGSNLNAVLQLQDGTANYGTVTNSFVLGQVTVLTQNFDSATVPALPSGWTSAASGFQSNWVTTTTQADTPPNSAYSTDATNIGVNALASPPFYLPLGQAQLSFRHRYAFEADTALPTNGYDGGVLEIQIGTNAFTDITNNGGSWVANGYNRKIDSRWGNPLTNRWAWSGTNSGFVTTTVSLPPTAAGQTNQLRWRAGTDNGNGGGGWWVDSISVIVQTCCANSPPILPGQTSRTIAELATLTVTNTATSLGAPASPLTYLLVNPPAGASINTNGVITWTPTQTQSPGTNILTTAAINSIVPSLSVTNSFTVVVQEVNVAPVLPVIAGQTVNELTLLTVTNTASETNLHATLGYTLVNPPAGAAIDTNGIITWTPSQNQSPGTNTLTTVVTNTDPYDLVNPHLSATNSFTVVVQEVNVAPVLPVIANQTVNELTLLTVTNTAAETNIHATLGYTLVNPPAGAAIDTNGIITWTPSQNQSPGTNTLTTVVTNTDPYDLVNPHLSATNSFTVVVREVNVAPVLPVIPGQTVNELTLLSVTNTASETNIHATLGYTLVNPPAGASINTNGVITWTPSQTQSPGTNTLTTVVTNTDPYDPVNPHLSATNSFTVVVQEGNVAPVLSVIADQTVNELTLLSVTNTASETNIHATLGYTLVNPPAGAAIDASGIITWTPSQNQSPGTNTLTTVVTNTDPYDLVNPHLSATNSFTVVVQEVNVAPVLPVIADQTVNELTLLTVTNTASETNIHATLGYTLLNPPVGAAIDTNGIITWTPSQNQSPGTNTLTTVVTNTDSYDPVNPHLSATNSFTVVVQEVNVAPVLSVIADQTVNELTLLTVTNTASETNIHATLGYTLVNPPVGAAIDTNGIITWTPSQNQSPGTNTLTTVVTNTDPYDLVNPHLSATNSFTVVVQEVNVAPVLPVIANQTINELTLLTVTNTASETNIHATLGYTLVNPPAGASINTNGVITWTPSQTQSPGTNTLTTVVTNTDPYDLVNPHLSATNSFTVVVQEVNVAPVLSVIADQTVNELTLLSVTNTASETNIHATLGYTLVNPPAGAAIDTNGIITWTPSQNQSPGTNTLTTVVTNTDPYDLVNPHLSATNSFTVVVREVNVAPVLPVIADQTVNELTLLTVTNTASETNIHATLGYTLVNPPAGAAIDTNGIITWAPSQSQGPSTNTLTTVVTSTDPYDLINPQLSATNSFMVIVNAAVVVPPPMIQSISVSNGIVTITWSAAAGSTYMLEGNDDPTGTNWNGVPPPVNATGLTATATDNAGAAPQRFYRVRLMP